MPLNKETKPNHFGKRDKSNQFEEEERLQSFAKILSVIKFQEKKTFQSHPEEYTSVFLKNILTLIINA